jgi:hypothetical protein
MAETSDSLVIEHLRAMRTQMDRMREDDRTLHAEVVAIRHTQNAHTTLLQQCLEDIATIRVRLDRIERRLELTEGAK